MFHQGDLQSGISKAMSEGKLVTCFVTDGGEESQLWENEYLQHDSLKWSLLEASVLLRLTAGSQEAEYLAAIFPLPKTPTIVIIKNGELKEYMAAGVTREDFMRRMGVALGSRAPLISQPPTATAPAPIPIPQSSASAPRPQVNISAPAASTVRQPNTPSPNSESPEVQDLLAERGAKLETQAREEAAKEKAKRAAAAKAKREAEQNAAPLPGKSSADMKYALMQKKRQKEAKDERERILKRVADDKAERRNREIQRKSDALAKQEENFADAADAAEGSSKSGSVRMSKECNLQIRMFDGSTIRNKFPSSGSLLKDVRPWVDGKQEGDQPYTFKHVLTPMPNKNIQTAEEGKTLQSLGLTPSATLILLPVEEYTAAYSSVPGVGLVSSGLSRGYGLVSSGVGLVTGMLGSILGGGAAPAPSQQETTSPATSSAPSTGIRTLRDQEPKQDDRQFYNGNALNFEPRKDDEDKKDE